MEDIIWWLIAGTRGGINRARIINELNSRPYNANQLAKKLNLEIVGSYNPTACNLDSQDFYDGDHIRNDAIEKMLKQKGSRCSMP